MAHTIPAPLKMKSNHNEQAVYTYSGWVKAIVICIFTSLILIALKSAQKYKLVGIIKHKNNNCDTSNAMLE